MVIIDLRIVKGDTFPYNFVYKYRDGTPVDLTDFEVYALVKESDTSGVILDEWSVENKKLEIFPKDGRVRIFLRNDQTLYAWNRSVWSLVAKHKYSNYDKTLTKGNIVVIPGGSTWHRP